MPESDLANPGVSRSNLGRWIETLVSPRIGGRHAGDPGARAVAAALAEQMASFGLDAPPGWEGFCQRFPYLDGEEANVVGHLETEHQRLILLAAHYDGQGKHPAGMIYPGADDNASGIAALLEVARLTGLQHRQGAPPSASKIGWVFAALGAEEVGQVGARAYLASPSVELSRIDLMINLDMVGRPSPTAVSEAIGYQVLSEPAEKIQRHLELAASAAGIQMRPLDSFGPLMPTLSDAEIFAARVPTILLSTGLHADHHELTDTAEKIDYAQVERAVHMVLALAGILAGRR